MSSTLALVPIIRTGPAHPYAPGSRGIRGMIAADIEATVGQGPPYGRCWEGSCSAAPQHRPKVRQRMPEPGG